MIALVFAALFSFISGTAGADTVFWEFTTRDFPLEADSYSVGGDEDLPVVESEYIGTVYGGRRITRVAFIGRSTALITFADEVYKGIFRRDEEWGVVTFDIKGRNGGILQIFLAPDMGFFYSLESGEPPFAALEDVPFSAEELEAIKGKGLDDGWIESIRLRGTRFVKYRGTITETRY